MQKRTKVLLLIGAGLALSVLLGFAFNFDFNLLADPGGGKPPGYTV